MTTELGSFTMVFRAICLAAMLSLPTFSNAEEPRKVRIAMAGDSTMSSYAKPPADRPTLTGWGQVFGEVFKDNVEILNLAASGRSTRSFVAEKRWEKLLEAKPDYIFIQFGHNDQKVKELAAETGFREYLIRYIADARKIGAKPVLVTPVGRRTFDGDKATTLLQPWADAMKTVAKEQNVPLIDLHAKSMAYYQKLGDAGSAYLTASATDRTHFSRKGAQEIARLVAEEIPSRVPELKPLLK